MNLLRLGVFVSGEGTNLDTIIKAIDTAILPCSIDLVCSNKKCNAINIAKKHSIKTITAIWDKKKESREEYENNLVKRCCFFIIFIS